MIYKAKRLKNGFSGFQIECIEYYSPERRAVWEVIYKDESEFASAFTLRECKKRIDNELEKTE